MSYIWRSNKTAEELAKGFALFCKNNNVITRGFVRVGRTERGLRGLIASKDIKAEDNVVIVPDHAIMTMFEAFRSESFMKALRSQQVPLDFSYSRLSSRVGGTFLYDHHVLLGLYISHLILAAPEGERFRALVDYMPRGEGNFQELQMMLERAIDHCTLYTQTGAALANHHCVSHTDFRSVLMWSLCMVISRTIPVEHRDTLLKFSAGTPLEDEIADKEKEGKQQNASFHVAALCPLIDMINHDERENVAVCVPDVAMKHSRCVIARSLCNISKGEEITMRYLGGSHDMHSLKVFYGIAEYKPIVKLDALPIGGF